MTFRTLLCSVNTTFKFSPFYSQIYDSSDLDWVSGGKSLAQSLTCVFHLDIFYNSWTSFGIWSYIKKESQYVVSDHYWCWSLLAWHFNDILFHDFKPVAILWYGGGSRGLVICKLVKGNQPGCPPPLWVGLASFAMTPAELETHAFCGSNHVWTLDLSKYHPEKNMTHSKSVVFLRSFLWLFIA